MKRILCSMAVLSLMPLMAQWQFAVENNQRSAVLYKDGGEAALKAKKGIIFSMAGSGMAMKKVFDLSKLPDEWRQNINGAAIRLYACVADQSKVVKKLPQANGLTESIVVIVNGKQQVFPTSSKLFSGGYSWCDIPIPADMISGDQLDVVIRKGGSKTNDDYLYVMMDLSAPQTNSFMSISGGRTFAKEYPKYQPDRKGEFMARLVVSRDKITEESVIAAKNAAAAKPKAKPAFKPSVAATPADVKWNNEITEGGNCLIMSNDSPDAVAKKANRIFPMAGSVLQLRKEFDLTKLPADWRGELGGASLRVYSMVADQSKAVKHLPALNGFTEEIAMTINGKTTIIPTGSKLLKTSWKWIDIPISTDMLSGDKLTVVFNKKDSKTNDDYFYIGIDTSVPAGSTTMSANSGRSFQHQISPLGKTKGEAMIKLVLYKGKREVSLNFSKDPAAAGELNLIDGARMDKGLLVLDGLKAGAELKKSSSFNVTESGLTIAGVFRMVGNENSPAKKNHNMIVACKQGSWFIGRTGNQLNFSFCTDGALWNNALFGSEFPDLGEWMHLAAVFQHVNEPAQGNVGYLLSLYLNGELAGRKMFLYAKPTITSSPVVIGQGLEDYGFNGEFASFEVIARGLNEGEIDNLVKKADRISKLPPGFYEVSGNLNAAIDKLAASAKNKEGKWLAESLRRAAATGANQEDMMDTVKNVASVIASGKSGKALVEAWNSACDKYTLIDGGKSMLLVVAGKGKTTSPVAGFYNAVTGNDVFDGRNTGWLLNFDGKQIQDRSNGVSFEVSPVEKTPDGGKFTVTWKGNGFECFSNFNFSGDRLEQDFKVNNFNKNELLTVVDFPRYFLRKLPGKKDFLVYPYFSGVFYPNPTHSFGRTGIYPSAHSTMQFVGYYDNMNNGVYAAFEETDGSGKTQSVSGRSNIMEYKWNNPIAYPKEGKGGNGFKSNGNAVLQIYSGDWFEAGQIYKKFIEAKAPWAVTELPRKDTPKWYRDNCLWLVASKEHYLSLEYLREYFDIPYAVWYARWQEYVNDNGNMRIDINEPSAFAAKRLIPKGVYLHPYLNGRLFEFSEACVYTPNNKSRGAKENCLIQINGKPEIERYKYEYLRMCPDTDFWQEKLLEMAKSVSDAGLNGCYFDQLPCASPCPCFAKNHGHAPNDPEAWYRGYTTMLKELRKRHPQLGLDGEDNCEVYANTLDGFMTWRFGGENHVPLFQSIYGGGRTQFTARGFDAFGGNSGSYEASFAKMGEQFVWGEQIGWMHIFDTRWGTPRRIYAKKLAHLRRAMLGYLNEADMLRPLFFKEKMPRQTCHWGSIPGGMVTNDKIMSCAWKRLRDGRIAVLFTNITDEEIAVTPTTRYPGYDKLAVCAEGVKDVRYIDLAKSGNPEVKLGPYASCIWLLGKDYDRSEAEKIAETTFRVASYTDAGKSIYHTSPDFAVCKKLNAAAGRFFTAEDSSWTLYGFKEIHPSLGFNKSNFAPKEQHGNWIMARKGGAVYYGEVDFGDKSPKFIEIQIAVGKENAGGKIFFDDIGTNLSPINTFFEYTTEYTGGWFKWKNVRIPVSNLTGKRKMIFKFMDKDCCFRGWRAIY